MSSWPIFGPNHIARWPPSETSDAPAVTATAPVAPTSKAEPSSCSGERGVRANLGRRGGGPGGSSTGEEERPKDIAYNNAYVEG